MQSSWPKDPIHLGGRIFGIGLSRTGTKSLATALNTLGIATIWYPQDSQTFAELAIGKFRLSVLQRYRGIKLGRIVRVLGM